MFRKLLLAGVAVAPIARVGCVPSEAAIITVSAAVNTSPTSW
jgi:hypothetical protein